jgi:hypothetical protein
MCIAGSEDYKLIEVKLKTKADRKADFIFFTMMTT